ncbi:MAG: hypothetical protein QOJ63_27 [Solirubrobacteraceae bacterium]|jgi:hypothetical protein|nr:hypothetical protein [Solirubrobacteraceae bacterium]
MKRTRHTPEQVIRKLRDADRMLAEQRSIAEIAKELGVSENTYHRWRNQFGGMKADDVKRQRFWCLDRDADYGPLNGLARNRINPKLILAHWDDILRVLGSLSTGTVRASELLRVLQGGGRPTPLGRAQYPVADAVIGLPQRRQPSARR